MSGVQDSLDLKFHLLNGSDIGSKSFPIVPTIATSNEKCISQWPKDLFESWLFIAAVNTGLLSSKDTQSKKLQKLEFNVYMFQCVMFLHVSRNRNVNKDTTTSCC
ncbi:uncharacterized protein [Rutidosis leptorrhynchoides]|uniref:uncharacterized protein n=1 Tax=Rutidosis leptorrhynchoides TaxID=125765 RepID=UPI003A99D6B2